MRAICPSYFHRSMKIASDQECSAEEAFSCHHMHLQTWGRSWVSDPVPGENLKVFIDASVRAGPEGWVNRGVQDLMRITVCLCLWAWVRELHSILSGLK